MFNIISMRADLGAGVVWCFLEVVVFESGTFRHAFSFPSLHTHILLPLQWFRASRRGSLAGHVSWRCPSLRAPANQEGILGKREPFSCYLLRRTSDHRCSAKHKISIVWPRGTVTPFPPRQFQCWFRARA